MKVVIVVRVVYIYPTRWIEDGCEFKYEIRRPYMH